MAKQIVTETANMPAENTLQDDPARSFETLRSKIGFLQAMLHRTYGNERESFCLMDENLQENYLWACAEMADQCIAELGEVAMQVYESIAKSEVAHG